MARLATLHCTCLASIRDLVPTLPALNHNFTSLSQPTAWQLSSPCCSSLCIPTARPAVPPSPQAILAPESELSSICPWPHTDTRLTSDAAACRICPLPALHLRHRLAEDRYSLIKCWVRLTARPHCCLCSGLDARRLFFCPRRHLNPPQAPCAVPPRLPLPCVALEPLCAAVSCVHAPAFALPDICCFLLVRTQASKLILGPVLPQTTAV